MERCKLPPTSPTVHGEGPPRRSHQIQPNRGTPRRRHVNGGMRQRPVGLPLWRWVRIHTQGTGTARGCSMVTEHARPAGLLEAGAPQAEKPDRSVEPDHPPKKNPPIRTAGAVEPMEHLTMAQCMLVLVSCNMLSKARALLGRGPIMRGMPLGVETRVLRNDRPGNCQCLAAHVGTVHASPVCQSSAKYFEDVTAAVRPRGRWRCDVAQHLREASPVHAGITGQGGAPEASSLPSSLGGT
eukprot:jgi/Ulvmu1/2257/UM013_0104.1